MVAKQKKQKMSRRSRGAKLVEAEIASLERQLSEKREYLDAVKLIESRGGRVVLPSAKPETRQAPTKHVRAPKNAPVNGSRITWSGEMRRILSKQRSGISYRDLLTEIASGALNKSRSAGDKGFYQAIKRLNDAGELVKRGGLLYAPDILSKLEANGVSIPEGPQRSTGGSGDIIRFILKQNPKGLSGPELRELLRAHPDAPKSMQKHPHYIYNILGSLIGTGKITKANGKYLLAQPSPDGKGHAVH